MRILVVLSLLLFFSSSPALSMSDTTFEKFIKSREVVTTFYFQPNNEALTGTERARVMEAMTTLRELQENGRMIRVEGFSSPEGNQEKNFILSFFRARFVAELIEAEGLPAEVALTGYGDLRAKSDDHSKERRVEIASYIKPVGMKKVKVAKKQGNNTITSLQQDAPPVRIEQEIDSYRIDQAIRMKVEDKKGFADQLKELEEKLAPGLSQTKNIDKYEDLERGYSLWRRSVDPDYSPKLSQVKERFGNDLQRGFTQGPIPAKSPGFTKVDPAKSPGITMVVPVKSLSREEQGPDVAMALPEEMAPPAIDALMIEQAIMEKLGVEPTVPSGSVTQVDLDVPDQPLQ